MGRWWHGLRRRLRRRWLVVETAPDGTTRIISTRFTFNAAIADVMGAQDELRKRYGWLTARSYRHRITRHASSPE